MRNIDLYEGGSMGTGMVREASGCRRFIKRKVNGTWRWLGVASVHQSSSGDYRGTIRLRM